MVCLSNAGAVSDPVLSTVIRLILDDRYLVAGRLSARRTVCVEILINVVLSRVSPTHEFLVVVSPTPLTSSVSLASPPRCTPLYVRTLVVVAAAGCMASRRLRVFPMTKRIRYKKHRVIIISGFGFRAFG